MSKVGRTYSEVPTTAEVVSSTYRSRHEMSSHPPKEYQKTSVDERHKAEELKSSQGQRSQGWLQSERCASQYAKFLEKETVSVAASAISGLVSTWSYRNGHVVARYKVLQQDMTVSIRSIHNGSKQHYR